jgi:outer membrane protein assembly factor BamB
VAPGNPALLNQLPKKPPMVWEATIADEGDVGSHASPIVADGRVYLHSKNEKRVMKDGKRRKVSTEYLIAYALRDGRELWRVSTDDGKPHGSTPLAANGRVYHVRANGNLVCLAGDSGQELWKRDMGRRGTHSSLALVGNVLVNQYGREISGVDVNSGTKLWETKVKGWCNSVAVWKHGGRDYVIAGNEEITCLSASDGSVVWKAPGTKLKKDPASPAIVGDRMAVMWEGLGVVVYQLTPQGPKEVAKFDGFVPNTGGAHQATSPVFDGRRVFGVDKKKTFCFDAETGKLVWQGKDGNPHPSPILAGNKLIVCDKRDILLFNADNGQLLGEADIDSHGCASCALAGTLLIVNEGRKLRCYDLRSR